VELGVWSRVLEVPFMLSTVCTWAGVMVLCEVFTVFTDITVCKFGVELCTFTL
jgi:hypothetical protein